MRNLLFCLTAVLALTGCSSSDRSAEAGAATPQAAKLPAQAPLAVAVAAAVGRNAHASLPDRGGLLSFEAVQTPIRRGADTYYPIHLSEAHALNAVAPGGEIKIETPSGETQSFRYSHHSEDAQGNWTWVGSTADGLDAVITFGEDAVFGKIYQRDTEALRLTMANGRAWLVSTDPSKYRDGNELRDGEVDYLIPPNAAVAAAERKRVTSASAAEAVAPVGTKSTPANTVDIVLGYTPGMVTRLGSAAAVTTRLTNLIAITNQAYQRSLVTPRVRLVHTMQVNYTDTNTNETALEALTGVVCNPNCSSTPVPAELQPLRTARDQFGGDLVSLVRPFRAPEQDGCGIAWLLGFNNSTIDSTDAPFGYSVVSDGTDLDETDGNTYGCREETLAHELGHNMGQAHNTEDSGGTAGTHTYSYGYREASTTGFYTIMAYRLPNSSQFAINHFGNPAVTYASTGRPTGTANADNARSLNLSMPLVVPFRNAVVPFASKVRHDLNGDGRSDLALWSPTQSYLGIWAMNGAAISSFGGFAIASGQEPVSIGYPIVQSRASVLSRNAGTSTLHSYIWNGSAFAQGTIGGYANGWFVIGQGDVNNDGKEDIFWRNPTSGQFSIWIMDGSVFVSAWSYSPPVTFSVTGIADFNGDGITDILWNDPGSRNASIWVATGSGYTISQLGQYGSEWTMLGAADVTGDGKADVILRSNDGVYLAYWRMNGPVYQDASAFGVGGRTMMTTGDYDGDGIQDIVLTDNATLRNLWLWRSTGTGFTQSSIGQYGSGWSVMR